MDIRQLRRTARLTQVELANETGISRMKVSLAECGYVELTEAEEHLVRQAVRKAHANRSAVLDKQLNSRVAVGA